LEEANGEAGTGAGWTGGREDKKARGFRDMLKHFQPDLQRLE
jgi:hypothetical protein